MKYYVKLANYAVQFNTMPVISTAEHLKFNFNTAGNDDKLKWLESSGTNSTGTTFDIMMWGNTRHSVVGKLSN